MYANGPQSSETKSQKTTPLPFTHINLPTPPPHRIQDIKGKGLADTKSRAIIKSLIANLITIGTYLVETELVYIEETKLYYKAECARMSGTMSHSKYLLHCAARIEQEEMRLRDYFPQETWAAVIKCVEECLILPKVVEFAEQGK